MKTLISLISASMLFAACNDGDTAQPPAGNTDSMAMVEEPLWENSYRCAVTVDPELRFEDEAGFRTLSDSALAATIFDALEEGKLDVYDDNMNVLPRSEALDRLKYFKSVMVEVEPGIYEQAGDTMQYAPQQVIEILSREHWRLVGPGHILKKEVSAYAPVVRTFDEEGNPRGKKVLFWVKNTPA